MSKLHLFLVTYLGIHSLALQINSYWIMNSLGDRLAALSNPVIK